MKVKTKTYVKILNIVPKELDYFYIENTGSASSTLYLKRYMYAYYDHDNPQINLYYSSDKQNWDSVYIGGQFYTTVSIAEIGAGERLYLKGDNSSGWNYSPYYSTNEYYNWSFIIDTQFAIGGNIMSLLYNDNARTATSIPTTGFLSLFGNGIETGYANTGLTDASDLNWGSVANEDFSSYKSQSMFSGCTNLSALTLGDFSGGLETNYWELSSTGDLYVPNLATKTNAENLSPFTGWDITIND